MTDISVRNEQFSINIPSGRLDIFSSRMARILTAWIVIVAFLSFITVPWFKDANSGDLTPAMIWFYHAIMLPASLLFLILCTRVFVTHNWVRYLISHSALVAIFEGAGFLILGYGNLHHIGSLSSFGYWVIMPCTLELFAITVIFVLDLAYGAFRPPLGESVSPQKAEIRWAMFFAGISVLTWVVLGLLAAASQVGISWSFWASWQHESSSALVGNIITSHSHGMLPSFMAGIVFLAAEAFGYSGLAGIRKQSARIGVAIMLGGIALYSGIYAISAIGTFAIPAWFPSGVGGANGIAMDDSLTGLVGLGALILACAMLPEIRGSFRNAGNTIKKHFNPVRLAVYMTYVMASVAMFVYGYFIEMNESRYGFASTSSATSVVNDQIFTRAHLLLVFGSLPVIAVFLLAAELLSDTSGIGAKLKNLMSVSVLVGMILATIGLGVWTFSAPGHGQTLDTGNAGAILYVVGQCLILFGGFIQLFTMHSPELQDSPAVQQYQVA